MKQRFLLEVLKYSVLINYFSYNRRIKGLSKGEKKF